MVNEKMWMKTESFYSKNNGCVQQKKQVCTIVVKFFQYNLIIAACFTLDL